MSDREPYTVFLRCVIDAESDAHAISYVVEATEGVPGEIYVMGWIRGVEDEWSEGFKQGRMGVGS